MNYGDKKFEEDFLKAKDLKVVVKFEKDNSPEGKIRAKQARAIICEMILLAQKRGRPARQEEILDDAA